MAKTSSAAPASTDAAPRTVRPRVDPARKLVGAATLMVVLGSFMPWIDTAVGTISGGRGPGLWTFYAAMLGLAAALIPYRTAGGVQAAIFSVVALGLPTWQVLHLVSLVGFTGWMPGPGLVFVVGGGVMAGIAAVRMLRPRA